MGQDLLGDVRGGGTVRAGSSPTLGWYRVGAAATVMVRRPGPDPGRPPPPVGPTGGGVGGVAVSASICLRATSGLTRRPASPVMRICWPPRNPGTDPLPRHSCRRMRKSHAPTSSMRTVADAARRIFVRELERLAAKPLNGDNCNERIWENATDVASGWRSSSLVMSALLRWLSDPAYQGEFLSAAEPSSALLTNFVVITSGRRTRPDAALLSRRFSTLRAMSDSSGHTPALRHARLHSLSCRQDWASLAVATSCAPPLRTQSSTSESLNFQSRPIRWAGRLRRSIHR